MTGVVVWVVFALASVVIGLLWHTIIKRARSDLAAGFAAAATVSLALLVADGVNHALSGWSFIALVVAFPISFAIAWSAVKWSSRV